ncbi:MAG TPA: YggS family pyridoxal phosphate-dependent enzyme [bacterium]|nr:YggS family pyridoxal phosphate-dependent enzyme [bacterium]
MISKSLLEIHRRIAAAASRVGRAESEVTLVAVCKAQPREKIQEAVAAGQRDFGENYARELLDHFGPGALDLRLHFIGHLQRNKVKLILPHVILIHSVDSAELAQEIDKRSAALGKTQAVLLEVNLGDESSKTGIAPEAAASLIADMALLKNVELRGLMAIPPPTEDPEEGRKHFRLLREIRDALNRKSVYKRPLADLSMGMTHDFETAVEEGATIVRVGTGIFGERQKT